MATSIRPPVSGVAARSKSWPAVSRNSIQPPNYFAATRRNSRIVVVTATAQVATTWAVPSAARDYYHTLGISLGASEQDIKKAYRRLALQYHPDVCKGDHCSTKFMQINQAYETVMNVQGLYLLEELPSDPCPDGFMGVDDDSWEDWEEWMGWEGAGTRDYTTHINYSV